MTNIAEQTLASIVTNNHHAVPVLEKYDLDYCCKGKRTLSEACKDKGLAVTDIARELQQPNDILKQPAFKAMNASELISYIYIHHHFYVKQSMPTILNHLEKVVFKHGDNFPFMRKVLDLFVEIENEMTTHMQKEELIMFPRIKEIETLYSSKQQISETDNYIMTPIQVLETEHDRAGEILYEIRGLTNNYTVPQGACTTFKITLEELKEFENDLHTHVHLENNLLFPMAESMFQTIKNNNIQEKSNSCALNL